MVSPGIDERTGWKSHPPPPATEADRDTGVSRTNAHCD
jgi:hypothetical protein